jgi:hypothetical protein
VFSALLIPRTNLIWQKRSGDNEDLLTLMSGLTDQAQASVRWAIGATTDNWLELVLQALPASASVLNGKPLLKG